jgi:hypothetical protein
MSTSIPDAATVLSAAHHRALHKRNRPGKAKQAKAPSAIALLARIGIVAVVLCGLIAGVNFVMLAVLN